MTITPDAIIDALAGADTPLSSMAVAKVLETSQTRKVVGLLTGLVRDEILERAKGGKYRLRDAGRYDAPLATSGTRRTLLPTNKQEIAASERRKVAARLTSSRKDKPVSGKKAGESLPPPQPAIKTAQNPAQEYSALPNGTIPVDKPCKPVDKSVDKPVISKSTIRRVAAQKVEEYPITTLEEIEVKVDEEKARDQRIRDIQRRERKRAEKMPDITAALQQMFEAYQRLRDLGWNDAVYCPKDGTMFDSISAGSTGVHDCFYRGEWPKGGWWVAEAGDIWPSSPILFKRKEEDAK